MTAFKHSCENDLGARLGCKTGNVLLPDTLPFTRETNRRMRNRTDWMKRDREAVKGDVRVEKAKIESFDILKSKKITQVIQILVKPSYICPHCNTFVILSSG